MKPFYEHAGITIYHGDCREILPGLPKCDLLLTDPPYGLGRHEMADSRNNGKGRRGYEAVSEWDKLPPDSSVFAALFQQTSEQVIWGANYFTFALAPSMGWLVWDKGQRIAQSDGELAYTSRHNALRIYVAGRHLLDGDGACHPTQKPVALMKWCISLFPEVQTVLDPFCGSGTTLVAAKDMRLSAIGIEREEKYCEIAAKRLSQEVFNFEVSA